MKLIQAGCSSLLLLLLGGCIEFEHQEVRWRYLPQEDVLVATLRYEGIYGGGGDKEQKGKSPGPLNAKEVEQLASVMQGQRAFFFNNWIAEFNRDSFQEALAKIDEGPEALRHQALDLLLKETRVDNVGFYLDAKGRLCGAQTLRIGNVKRLLGLANDVISKSVLESVQKHLDGKAQKQGGSRAGSSGAGPLNAASLLKRLKKVEYEQMRLSGMVRIQGKFRINLVDNREGVSFWLEEGSTARGFTLLQVDMDRGFARIRKNGQTAKVYLRSKKVVAQDDEEDLPLELLQMMVRQVESKTPFLTLHPRGLGFRMPFPQEEFEDFREKNAFPKGMAVIYADNFLDLRIAQDAKAGGVLRKECFSGYVPNALEHVRKKYGLRKQSAVDAELERFLGTGVGG